MSQVRRVMRETATGTTDEVRTWIHRRLAEVVDSGWVVRQARLTPAPSDAPVAGEALIESETVERLDPAEGEG